MKISATNDQTHLYVPPISWGDVQIESAFTEYLQNLRDRNTNEYEWRLFHLGYTSIQAKLAKTFHELMVTDHIHGFTPLPHQLDAARRVLQELRGRAILADEVGLGKTIEAGLILKEYQLRGLVHKALILVPASLVLQWTRELNEKFRIGCFAQRNEWSWSHYDVIVASLDTAKREPHRSYVLNTPWDLVIVDEAHKLKNSKSKNWELINQLTNKFMLLLTATPMQNELRELHTLITLLKPGHLGNRRDFQTQYVLDRRTPKDSKQLRTHVGHVMIRNRRMDGATSLPPRHVETVPLELSSQERILYDSVQQFLKVEFLDRQERRISVLPLITLQREICSSPYAAMITMERMKRRTNSAAKQSALDRLITLAESVQTYTKVNTVLEMLDQFDDKCIVFTEYRATQDFLLYMLKKRGISAVPFRGGFGRGKKDWMKDLFARKTRVLVATESGGEGINLQFCSRMINFDLPWNPMRLEQRIGRIHRLGQEKSVHIYNLSTKDTIEEHIVQLLHDKIRVFEMVIGELDYIIGEKKFDASFEKNILNWSLTSSSNTDLRDKVMAYGDQWLESTQGEPS